MPTYEYKCEKCGAQFEVTRKMTDPEGKVECPVCKETDCHRVYNGLLTGSGRSSVNYAPRHFG